MDSSAGDHGAAKTKDLRLLLPFTCDDLRVPHELIKEIGSGEARIFGGPTAKPWPVEVGQDNGGVFLGRGWPEFAAACGADEGWILVIRHRGSGLLTIKMFDSSCCSRELRPSPPAAEATTNPIAAASHKPQFISIRPQDFMEKMLIPAQFVEHYIPKEHLKHKMGKVTGPLGIDFDIDVEMNQPDVFLLAGGWPQFVKCNGITEANSLVFKYEGDLQLKVKVFEPNGFLRLSRGMQEVQEASMSLKKTSLRRNSFYEPSKQPSWIKKEINSHTLKRELSLAKSFCDAIGLLKPCRITLRTSANSTESWELHGQPSKKSSYHLRQGWQRFCRKNCLKEGDTCTFNVIKTTLWHVDITRCKERYLQKFTSTCSSKRKSKDDIRSSSKGQKMKMGSSMSRCDFQTGQAPWIQKKINSSKIENRIVPAVRPPTPAVRQPGLTARLVV